LLGLFVTFVTDRPGMGCGYSAYKNNHKYCIMRGSLWMIAAGSSVWITLCAGCSGLSRVKLDVANNLAILQVGGYVNYENSNTKYFKPFVCHADGSTRFFGSNT